MSRTKYLIINADDFNLTPGVSRAILGLARNRAITSTSVLVNNRYNTLAEELKKTPIGVGLHFTITCGKPVAPRKRVQSLVTSTGIFRRIHTLSNISLGDIRHELDAQIERFCTLFSALPTHIDTHHQVHYYKKIFTVLSAVARGYALPIRKRYVGKVKGERNDILTPDYTYYRFNARWAWNEQALRNCVKRLRSGVSEIIVHPGISDALLRKKSSFAHEREREYYALMSPTIQQVCKQKKIQCITYHDLKAMRGEGMYT